MRYNAQRYTQELTTGQVAKTRKINEKELKLFGKDTQKKRPKITHAQLMFTS